MQQGIAVMNGSNIIHKIVKIVIDICFIKFQVLKPMKTITTILSTESSPSISMIVPVKERIKQLTLVNESDSRQLILVKNAIWMDLVDRFVIFPLHSTYPDEVTYCTSHVSLLQL